jgi:hypothetical protein
MSGGAGGEDEPGVSRGHTTRCGSSKQRHCESEGAEGVEEHGRSVMEAAEVEHLENGIGE